MGGHGGTGIHADKNDKYKEIVQRISLHATPDLTRCKDTETETENKSQYLEHDIMSSNYSVLDGGDRYSLATRSSINSAMLRRVYGQDIAETVGVQRAPPRQVEEVHVHQCRVCTIL